MAEKTMQQETENKMGTMPVGRLLLTMALPMMISMLVQALYNIVDSIFVSRICEDALTAVSMAFPIQNLMIGLASGLGVGTNALLSRCLGEKNTEQANRIAMNGILLTGVGYVIFLILGLTISRPFYVIQGASDAIADYGYDYISIVMIYSFGLFFQMIFERLLQGTGRTIHTMFTQGTGAVINLILDPILIFGYFGMPEMGIAGAAIATVIGQIVAGIMALVFNIIFNKEIRLKLAGFKPSLQIMKNILFIGVPSVVMVAIGSVMTFSVNKILVVFTSTAVAVFGIYFKLQSFAFMPMFGLNNAMVPIVAYNYGAGKPDRMKQTLKLSTISAMVIMLLALAAVHLFPVPMLRLFNASDNMLAIGVPALRLITISFVFAGFCITSSSYFQALGYSMYSMILSFARQLVVLVPLVYVFSKTGNLSLVWLAWPIAEFASLAVSLYYRRRIDREVISKLQS